MAIDLTVSMINATVQVDQPQADGKRIVGTAFLVQAPKPDGTARTVLITAGHVLTNMPGPSARIGYRFQGADGTWHYDARPLTIRDGASVLWTRNPAQDVAVMAIEAPPEFARAAIPLSWLADDTTFERAGVGPGDEMFLLGYPEGYTANIDGFPILRSGRVASYPLGPVTEFPTFILDAQVTNGYSGAPVFMTSDMRRRPAAGAANADFVAGVMTSQLWVNGERLGLGFVVPASFIRQTIALLDQPKLDPDLESGSPAPTQPATTAR